MPSISYHFGIPGISLDKEDKENFFAFIQKLSNQYSKRPEQPHYKNANRGMNLGSRET